MRSLDPDGSTGHARTPARVQRLRAEVEIRKAASPTLEMLLSERRWLGQDLRGL